MRRAWHDIVDPFPGRLAQAWRIALVCALTTCIAEVYGIPEAAISCFLVFFVMKPDAASGSVLAIGLAVLVMLVVLICLLLIRFTIDAPALRILAIATTSLVLLFAGSASKLGEMGGIVALVIAMILGMLNDAPTGELATRAVLYAWLMATLPAACVVLVNLIVGRNPVPLLRATVAERLVACADFLADPTPATQERLESLLWRGQEDEQQRFKLARALALGKRSELLRLARALQESYRLGLALVSMAPDVPTGERVELARQVRHASSAFARGAVFDVSPTANPAQLAPAWDALLGMAGTPDAYPKASPGESFLRQDAWSNADHIKYAVKTTAAALTCYFIYTAWQWQGIHTAMITCYVAALGSVAETTHKLVLRICGCLVGAALGIASIVFVMPHMSSVGSLVALVFAVTLLSAWIWVGDERVAYAGVQVALAFLLTVLQGFGPTTDLDTARDRVLGVLLGNVVLYAYFTQLWPASVLDQVWQYTRQALNRLADMAHRAAAASPADAPVQADLRDREIGDASIVASHLAQTQRALQLAGFEGRYRRPSAVAVQRLAAIDGSIKRICGDLMARATLPQALAERLATVAQRAGHAAPRTVLGTPSAASSAEVSSKRDAALEHEIRRLEALLDER